MAKLVYGGKEYSIDGGYEISNSNNEVSFNDITIDFTGHTFADIPFKYQKVEIKEGNNVIFTGYVDDVLPSKMKNVKEERDLKLTLLSPLKMATVRTYSLIGTYSIKEAMQRVLSPLINDGFSIKELNVGEGQITVNFVLETVENCMNSICSKRNIFWTINEKREIFINSIDLLFGRNTKLKIDEKDIKNEIELYDIIPTIENVDYANIINFKNVRLIYWQSNTTSTIDEQNIETGGYPITRVGKTLHKGDVINFENPVIVDEKTLRSVAKEYTNEDGEIEEPMESITIWINWKDSVGENTDIYSIYIDTDKHSPTLGQYVTTGSIGFDNEKVEKDIVLIRDSFYSNLITGFKWNGRDNVELHTVQSTVALRYTTMKFIYSAEIEKLKGIVSDSGQIEKTIDYNSKWTTINNLINYGRSLIVQNSNVINTVQLCFTKNPNLKIGDLVEIEMPSFYVKGKFAVNKIDYTYQGKEDEDFKITLKNSDFISTYIDMFRPIEKEENSNKVNTVLLSEFIEEEFNEKFTINTK